MNTESMEMAQLVAQRVDCNPTLLPLVEVIVVRE